MSDSEHYDLLVLGSGEAGKYLAWHVASEGKRVAVIERRYIGGSCPNIACLPSKNIIHSARIASYFRRSEEFGIRKDGWTIDMAGVRERKRRMVDGLIEVQLGHYKRSGAELVAGQGRFIAPKTLEVALADGGSRILRGERIIISTGTHATVEGVPGLVESRPMTHVEALELDRVPERLLIVGGGYVGLEFAQAMRRFGSRVTLIERNARLAHREDADIVEALHELCRDEGIDVCTETSITRVRGISGQEVQLHTVRDGTETVLKGTHLLVAAGRTPNTDGIGLELAGVQTTARGYIQVNERLETTAPDVWAVGECAGSPQFTHVAFDDFRVVRDNLVGKGRTISGRQIPSCLFTDPEFARVGLSEREAREQGVGYRLAKLPMAAVLRARTLSEERGFMKALVAADSDRILGFAAFGADVGELMAAVQVVMGAGLPYTVLRDAVIAHPTMSEAFAPLFSKVSAPVAA